MYAGELVGLRAREPEDAERLLRWFGDPETMRWWDRTYPPGPVEVLAARIEGIRPSYAEPSFMAVDLATGTTIGLAVLVHPSPVHRHAAVGLLVGEAAYRGRGYGTDLTRTICRFGFEQMNLVRISLTVIPENTAARRAYERVGFVEEGLQRRAFYKRGTWYDLLHMALVTSQ